MSKDRAVGFLILLLSAAVIPAYIYFIFLTEFSLLLLKITAAIAVIGVFGVLGWIGYILATTPPPKWIEEMEKEIWEKIKKIEEEKGEERE